MATMASILDATFSDGEESETEFNPGAQDPSDDEAETRPPRPDNSSTKPSTAYAREELQEDDEDVDHGEDDEGEGEDLGNANDDDDEEDEDDEDDEDAVGGRPRKRRRRRLNQFIEEEAEVDEDDDDLEGDEDEGVETGFIAENVEDDAEVEADHDDRRHRELDRQRQVEADMDAEAAAAKFRERYGRRTTQGLARSSFVPQNLLMPSVDDPSIWGVGCKPGKEKEACLAIMKKLQTRIAAGRPLRICSAFERGGPNAPMSGYIWVEARRQADVIEAVTGTTNIYVSKIHLVPVKEMPDLLRVKKSKQLEIGGYVRMKRGLYAGDLGMIEQVEDNGNDVSIRLVPRLSYGADEDDNRPAGAEKRKRIPFAPAATPTNRPPQRLFSENEAKKRHSRFLQPNRLLTKGSWTYKGDIYEDGFLIKTFRTTMIESENVNPRLDEITKLTKTAADGSETLDLETLAHSMKNNTAEGTYVPGDDVEVYQGEQKGIIGKVEGISAGILRIKVSEGELKGQIVEQPVKGVRKRFREGDHVKVIGGKYTGEVGMIIKLKDDRVTVLTDTATQEITVFSRDLREAAEAGGSEVKSSGFDVQDLVQINATQVGIVIKADMEAVRILDENSSVVTRLPSQLQKVEERKNAVATDRNGSEIRVGDRVKEAGGESKEGQILHINRGHVFVHDRTRIENSGLWTTRCMNIITVASKANMTQSSGPDLTKMNPALKGLNGSSMAPPVVPRVGRDRLINQRIKIRKGNYKGHDGLVKDTTATHARVELQSKNKIINVLKTDVAVIDAKTGQSVDYNSFANSRGPAFPLRTGGPSSRVPDGGFAGSRTPMLGDGGGRTPAWGGSSSRTPAWSGGGNDSRTPAWKAPSGGATSYGGSGNMTSYGGSGGMTSYGGTGTGGSRTPAWNSSSRTPYGGDSGFGGSASSGYDAFAAGSRTPYGASGSRTPYDSHNAMSAPTPAGRDFDAPTPATSAPTPGGFDNYNSYASAPTPGAGFSMDAPTPGFAKGSNREELKYNRLTAPTPGAYEAPTPAAGPTYADDDDD